MRLVIVLEREVTDEAQGQQIFDLVKTRLEDHPEVRIHGDVTNTMSTEPT